MAVTRWNMVCFVVCIAFVILTSLFYQLRLGILSPPPSSWDTGPYRPLPLDDPLPVFGTNESYVLTYLRRAGYPAQRGVGVRRETPDPLERHLFRNPPTTDSLCLPEELNSKVHVLNPADHYTVGDTLRLRVDLYTGYRKPRHSGGDDVRIWLKSANGTSSVVAKVTDLSNGSYLGEAVLKWPGVTLARVSLTYPQEYVRALSEMLYKVHCLRWITAVFDNGQGTRETTVCSPFQPIPGFDDVCNLTSQNGDRSWFCARPVSKGVNCSQWKATHNLNFQSLQHTPLAHAIPSVLKKLWQCCDTPQRSFRLIPNTIRIDTKQSPRKKPPALPPCWSRPLRDTWQSAAHTGWLHNGTWRPNTCLLPTLTKQRLTRCMRNTTLVLLGDSNQRFWFDAIKGLLPCRYREAAGLWHAPRVCQNHAVNSTLMFLAHGLPFSPGTHSDLVNVPLPQALERLLHYTTPGGKAVIVVHYFRHFVIFALNVYRQRVRQARQTLEEFVQRHPEVTVIIRGPHALYNYKASPTVMMIGDVFVTSYIRVWKEEFRGLEDKVWFLDYWDLTLAAENMESHPKKGITKEMLRVLFGHMCQRIK